MIDASILIEISNEELSMHTYDRLDNQIDQALVTIGKDRKRKKVMALSLFAAAAVALFALTYAMYNSTPGQISPDRIGVGAVKPLVK